MFVLGVLARCQPIYQHVSAHRFGWIVSAGAVALIAGMAYYKLLVLPPVLDSALKRDLAGPRVINFLAIAWIATNFARYGIVKEVATRLPWIGAVGHDGMVSFVAGAVISLVVDSILFTLIDGLINVPAGLAADAIAIGALLAVPRVHRSVAGWLGTRRPRRPRRSPQPTIARAACAEFFEASRFLPAFYRSRSQLTVFFPPRPQQTPAHRIRAHALHGRPRHHDKKGRAMLELAIMFAIISVVAGLFGFTRVSSGAVGIAKICFFIFLVLFVIFLIIAITAGSLVL